ncbi:MAG: hypothetical protein IJU16_07810, partial [Clostridia bacterium]|nr:hypothetical protein [Clostridia bacterium]
MTVEEVDSAASPIAYEKTVKMAHTGNMYTFQCYAPVSTFPNPDATKTWTLSFWAKVNGQYGAYLQKKTTSSGTLQSLTLTNDDAWHYYVVPLALGDNITLSAITLYYSISPQTTLSLNGVSLVPGTVALANDSFQNSAALKNETIRANGNAIFNTAIE